MHNLTIAKGCLQNASTPHIRTPEMRVLPA
jgi:hypothetical protein